MCNVETVVNNQRQNTNEMITVTLSCVTIESLLNNGIRNFDFFKYAPVTGN